MPQLQDVEPAPYPPAPWQFTGQMWTGLFRSSAPRPLPAGLKHVLDPHLFLVAVVRYLDGPLHYDELFFATPAWLGMRPGIHVDEMWVDSVSSLWGGRRIWGLPKNVAQFSWQGSTLSVSDSIGQIAKIELNLDPSSLPWLWFSPPEFGYRDQTWLYFWSSIWGRLDLAPMKIIEWSDRYPLLAREKSILSVGAKPFRMNIPAPAVIQPSGQG